MIVVTTDKIEGRDIARVLGLVRGNTIRARHIGKDNHRGVSQRRRRRGLRVHQAHGRGARAGSGPHGGPMRKASEPTRFSACAFRPPWS